MRTEHKWIFCLLVILTSALIITACGSDKDIQEENATKDNAGITLGDQVETFEINTKYGRIDYPKEWQDMAEITVSDEKIEVALKASDAGNQKVFDICFGGEDGAHVGTLRDNGIKVYVITYEPDKDARLTEQEQQDFYAMTEDLNYILRSLSTNCGMKLEIDA